MNGYGADVASDDWLISPRMGVLPNASLTFDV